MAYIVCNQEPVMVSIAEDGIARRLCKLVETDTLQVTHCNYADLYTMLACGSVAFRNAVYMDGCIHILPLLQQGGFFNVGSVLIGRRSGIYGNVLCVYADGCVHALQAGNLDNVILRVNEAEGYLSLDSLFLKRSFTLRKSNSKFGSLWFPLVADKNVSVKCRKHNRNLGVEITRCVTQDFFFERMRGLG